LHRYKELSVWKKAMNLTSEVYALTENFPSKEQFGLINQIRRSSVSIASNIAEGAGRNSKAEFKQFIRIAVGSTFELETQLLISQSVSYCKSKEINKLTDTLGEMHRMLIGLRASLK